jgi:Flp pilus assembly pilin Flp
MLRQFVINREGQDVVEYGLLVALVILGAVVAVGALAPVISAVWTAISANLAS